MPVTPDGVVSLMLKTRQATNGLFLACFVQHHFQNPIQMWLAPHFLTQVGSTLSTDTWDETRANFICWGLEVSFTRYALTEPSPFILLSPFRSLGAPCFPGMFELQLTDP